MALSRKADVILIAAVVVLVFLSLLPTQESPQIVSQNSDSTNVLSSTPDNPIFIEEDQEVKNRLDEALEALAKHQDEIDKASEINKKETFGRSYEPIIKEPPDGELMPLCGGAVWTYNVFGSPELVTSDNMVLRILKEPEGQTPGLVETVFGESSKISPIYKKKGIQFTGLPFVTPREFLDARPHRVKGRILPTRGQMVTGAVWTEIQHRKLIYRYHDSGGKAHALKADATIKNRANAHPFETVVVPAGRFGAYRIEWIGRVEIAAKKRAVLEYLTTEPYRRETMWVTPGVGIIKREINYLAQDRTHQTVNIVLQHYSSGQDCQFSDL